MIRFRLLVRETPPLFHLSTKEYFVKEGAARLKWLLHLLELMQKEPEEKLEPADKILLQAIKNEIDELGGEL